MDFLRLLDFTLPTLKSSEKVVSTDLGHEGQADNLFISHLFLFSNYMAELKM